MMKMILKNISLFILSSQSHTLKQAFMWIPGHIHSTIIMALLQDMWPD